MQTIDAGFAQAMAIRLVRLGTTTVNRWQREHGGLVPLPRSGRTDGALVAAAGCRLLFLPRSSPDFNLIALVFAPLMQVLRETRHARSTCLSRPLARGPASSLRRRPRILRPLGLPPPRPTPMTAAIGSALP